MQTIGDRLKLALDAKSARSAERVTGRQLAAACDVSAQAVSQWMLGQSKGLRPDNLFLAADFLGVEARWLATGDGPMHAQASLPMDGLTSDQRATLQAFVDSFRQSGRKTGG